MFHHGVDLPEFAAFPLVEERGRPGHSTLLRRVRRHRRRRPGRVSARDADLAGQPRLGHAARLRRRGLDRANRASVELVREFAAEWPTCRGCSSADNVGPRGDGYKAGAHVDPDEAADYHRAQLGLVRRGRGRPGDRADHDRRRRGDRRRPRRRGRGLPVGVSLHRRDRRSAARGSTLGEVIAAVDADGPAGVLVINCAHPTHVAAGRGRGCLAGPGHGLRVNASTMSHEELDNAEELDEGDPAQLAAETATLRAALPDRDDGRRLLRHRRPARG